MATRLRFPVFVGSFTTEGKKALLELRKRLPAALRKFLGEHHTSLSAAVTDDPRYELRLRVLQELAPKDPNALAIQYTRYDDLSEDERKIVDQLGRRGNVIIKERLRNVAGADELSPTQVVAAVQARISFRFTTGDFQRAWKALKARPAIGATNPERTDEKYCAYYPRHRDYGYRPAYVEKLVRECATAEEYTALTGKPARDKLTGLVVGADTT